MDNSSSLKGLDVHEHLQDDGRKQLYVNAVFETVASSYDRFTRWSSLGLDMVWKRELVRLVKSQLRPHDQILDLATGTGDLVFALAACVREGKLIGLDISAKMIELADQTRRRRKVGNAEFRVGDMMNLEFPDASIDAVTISYGLRNCPDIRRALKEIHRVLKPGGIVASLELVRPSNVLWERLSLTTMLAACSFWGWLWHGEPASYGYLAHSITHFVSRLELSRTLTNTGFHLLVQHSTFFDLVAIHFARKIMGS